MYYDEDFRSAAFEQQLEAGLQHLTGLTALLLANFRPLHGNPPLALAGLSCLRRLCVLSYDGPLPLGPYSTSLRLLGASLQCLNCSTALLASCDSLEHAAVLRGDCDYSGPVWDWVAAHPPLRRLQMAHIPYHQPRSPAREASDAEPYEPRAVAWLRHMRPQLEVECVSECSFLAAFKWQDPFWDTVVIY